MKIVVIIRATSEYTGDYSLTRVFNMLLNAYGMCVDDSSGIKTRC